MVNFEEV